MRKKGRWKGTAGKNGKGVRKEGKRKRDWNFLVREMEQMKAKREKIEREAEGEEH